MAACISAKTAAFVEQCKDFEWIDDDSMSPSTWRIVTLDKWAKACDQNAVLEIKSVDQESEENDDDAVAYAKLKGKFLRLTITEKVPETNSEEEMLGKEPDAKSSCMT